MDRAGRSPGRSSRARDSRASAPEVYLGGDGDYLARWKRIIYLDQRLRAAVDGGGSGGPAAADGRDGRGAGHNGRPSAPPAIEELARACGVSTKTIRRDLESMRDELGAPIVYDAAARGWRYSEAGFAIPAADLSERDLFALMVAENAIAQYEGTPLSVYLRAAFDKVLAMMPGELRDRHALAARAIHFGGLPPPNVRPEIWSALAAAIDRGQELDIDYHRAGAKHATERRLHPYQLLVRDRDWFLVAHSPEAGRELLYYLPRIAAARPTGERFERRSGFDADSFHRFGFNAMQGPGEPTTVTLRFESAAAFLVDERPWAAEQTVRRSRDGSATVTFRSAALFEIERQVMRYGGVVEVVRPKALREAVRAAARRLVKGHGSRAERG